MVEEDALPRLIEALSTRLNTLSLLNLRIQISNYFERSRAVCWLEFETCIYRLDISMLA